MDEQEDYELLPRRQVEHLRKELDNLKANPFVKSHQGDKLFVSVNKLTDSVDKLYSLFENVNEEIVQDFENKNEDSDDKLQAIIEQNRHIAEGILSMADKLAEHEKHISKLAGHTQIGHSKEHDDLVAEFEVENEPVQEPELDKPEPQVTEIEPVQKKYSIDKHIDSISDHLDDEIKDMHIYTSDLNQSMSPTVVQSAPNQNIPQNNVQPQNVPQTNVQPTPNITQTNVQSQNVPQNNVQQIPSQNVVMPRAHKPTPLSLHPEPQPEYHEPVGQQPAPVQHVQPQNIPVQQPVQPQRPQVQRPTFEQRPVTNNLPYPASQPVNEPQNPAPINRQFQPQPDQQQFQTPQTSYNPPNISRSTPVQNNYGAQLRNDPSSVPPPPVDSNAEFINPNFPTQETLPAQTNAQPEMLAPINPQPRKKKKFLGFI